MNITIFGAGEIGGGICGFLSKYLPIDTLTIVDSNKMNLEKLSRKMENKFDGILKPTVLSVDNERACEELIRKKDMVISALPLASHETLLSYCLKSSTPILGVARPNYSTLSMLEKKAKSTGTTVFNACGLEPGLTECFATHLINTTSNIISLQISCGGVSKKPKPPLNYNLQFHSSDLPFYARQTYTLKNKQVTKVNRFSDIETFIFDDVGILERWNDGLTPWFIEHLQKENIPECTQKTIRWPGYAHVANFLNQAGFLEESKINVDNICISPKKFVKSLLVPQLQNNSRIDDIVIIQVEALAYKNRKKYVKKIYAVDSYNKELDLTPMTKITSFLAVMTAKNYFFHREKYKAGTYTAEKIFIGEEFNELISQLEALGMNITLEENSE